MYTAPTFFLCGPTHHRLSPRVKPLPLPHDHVAVSREPMTVLCLTVTPVLWCYNLRCSDVPAHDCANGGTTYNRLLRMWDIANNR